MMRFVAVNRRTLLQLTGALAAGGALRPWRALGQDQSVLRVRSYSDLQVLDPLNRLAQPEGDIMDAIFSNLVKAKPGEVWDWQLDAAESIEQVDDTHIDFTLKKGIQFTGGFGELTAEDVKYSFERIADPKNESPYRDDWAVLDRVEVKDPYNGTIVLKEPFAPLWTISLVRGSGSILSK
ncbi:MAG: ABC transporter substrate-binding protein, partial [Geminicoccaceae bacterium]